MITDYVFIIIVVVVVVSLITFLLLLLLIFLMFKLFICSAVILSDLKNNRNNCDSILIY